MPPVNPEGLPGLTASQTWIEDESPPVKPVVNSVTDTNREAVE